jgi:hemerythrin-like domain-containing protein
MTYIIDVLRQEHCRMESLLRVLERELDVFGRGDRPDYDVILGVIDYFKDYPDSCHHPKEDMIIEKLKARDPVAAAAVGDLEAQHKEAGRRLRRVEFGVHQVLEDQDVFRQAVRDIIRNFIDEERRHMDAEERIVFPAVLDALRPEDWSEIGVKLTGHEDPFSQAEFEEKFSKLRRAILKMEEEADAERSPPSAVRDSGVNSAVPG